MLIFLLKIESPDVYNFFKLVRRYVVLDFHHIVQIAAQTALLVFFTVCLVLSMLCVAIQVVIKQDVFILAFGRWFKHKRLDAMRKSNIVDCQVFNRRLTDQLVCRISESLLVIVEVAGCGIAAGSHRFVVFARDTHRLALLLLFMCLMIARRQTQRRERDVKLFIYPDHWLEL